MCTKTPVAIGIYCVALFFLSSCKHTKNPFSYEKNFHDPGKSLTKEAYSSILKADSNNKSTPSPKIKKQPSPNIIDPWPSKKVTLTVTPEASLNNVFYDLTYSVGLGVQYKGLDDKKGYVLHINKRPIREVVETLCRMANLRCTLKNQVVHIEPDTPYYVTYDIQFLSAKRSDEGHISISTDIFSMPLGKKEHNNYENGSSSRLKTEATVDFWSELETVLKTILLDPQRQSLQTSPKKTSSDFLQEQALPYALHKQAGLVTIYGNSKNQKQVYKFLERLKRKISSQVLIEAKVVEVTLHDQFKSGINWRSMLDGDIFFAAPITGTVNLANPPPFSNHNTATKNMVTFGASGPKFSSIMQLIESFGTVRTLSNPRITVINNQPAILKVAENKVYFQVKYDRKFVTDNSGNVSFSDTFATESQIHTIPIGFVMSVHPAIDVDNQEVILTLRPSITRTTSSVEDPAVTIVNSAVSSSIPVVEVREMDSVLRLKSGQIAVTGGLMQDRVQNTENGFPWLADIPIFGSLFKSTVDDRQVTELVIILQATILEDNNPIKAVTNADQRLYTQFAEDPRPFNLNKGANQ